MAPCEQHETIVSNFNTISQSLALLQKDIEYLRRDQETILARFGKHVEDADKEGGWHGRIIRLEDTLRGQRVYMVACGIIGGLVGSGSADAITRFLSIWK